MDFNARSSKAISERNIVGKIQKIFGLNGELVVRLWDNFPEEDTIFEEPLWIEINSKGVPVYIKSFKPQGMSKAVVIFEDWETEKQADELVGKSLYYENNRQSDDIMEGLQGWTISDKNSGRVGVVDDFSNSEINPLLFVLFDGKECMIPLVEEYIVSVDEKAKKIEVDLPDGLLDL